MGAGEFFYHPKWKSYDLYKRAALSKKDFLDYFVDGRRIGKSSWRRILQLPAKLEIEVSKPGFKLGKAFWKKVRSVAKNVFSGKWTIQ